MPCRHCQRSPILIQARVEFSKTNFNALSSRLTVVILQVVIKRPDANALIGMAHAYRFPFLDDGQVAYFNSSRGMVGETFHPLNERFPIWKPERDPRAFSIQRLADFIAEFRCNIPPSAVW